MSSTIRYYSTHCGTCETVCWLMESRNIPYEMIDNPDEIIQASEKYNCNIFPFAVIDGVFFDTDKLIHYILDYDK